MTMPDESRTKQRPLWRAVVAGCAWAAIVIAVFVLFTLVAAEFAWGLGQALHGNPDVAERVPRYWAFIAISLLLVVVAIAAAVARRWVAFALALVLAAASGFIAVGTYPSVQHIVDPVEQQEEEPLPCQCFSGGDCECPGG